MLLGERRWFPRLLWRAWYAVLAKRAFPPHTTVNADTWQLLDPVIALGLKRLCETRQLAGIEWTERGGSSFARDAARVLRELRERFGVEIWLDDLGSGEDGLGRCLLVQPDVVKLDGSLLHAARQSEYARNVLRRQIAAYTSQVKIVAEWIESESDSHLARLLGAHCGQGYYLSARH